MHYKSVIAVLAILFIVIACGNTKKFSESKENTKPQVTKTIKGSGTETQRITLNKGAAIFNYRYSGSHNFVIWLKYSNAKELELIVNKIGSTSGSISVYVPEDGTYILDVKSDGNWSIDIK